MQTFLPYVSFEKSAEVLDRQRLGKQRVEVLQILNALAGLSAGWVNHPATRMWRGHEYLLVRCGIAMCEEWSYRGYNDTTMFKILSVATKFEANISVPEWLGNEEFHLSHQSNLVRKDPIYYRQFFPNVPDNLEYVWPI